MAQADFKVVLQEIVHAARDGAAEANREGGSFSSGKVMAYYDVLTIAMEQAEVMNIPLDEIGLEGFDPDGLLGRESPISG
ncbi:MAG: hypothetical protein H3C26_00020 [Rhodocyclaceae bacterium]|nr:hypothetical protein [Rhodocyclaceae bacterium]